jgi:Fasciclin domain
VPANAGKNIVETALAAGKFTTLTSLVKQAGLAKTLQRRGPYTVFAPTDAAFARVPKARLKKLAKNKAELRSVLLYDVARGKLTAAKVVKRRSITMLSGERSRVCRRASPPSGCHEGWRVSPGDYGTRARSARRMRSSASVGIRNPRSSSRRASRATART